MGRPRLLLWGRYGKNPSFQAPDRALAMFVTAHRFASAVIVSMAVGSLVSDARADEGAKLRFEVSDGDGQPLPCRIHLTDGAGQPVLAPPLPAWKDHFVCNGRAEVSVKPGR